MSAIASGGITVTPGDTASLGVAQTISRDTSGANDALTKQFTDAKRNEIAQGFEATRQLVSEVGTFFSNRAADEKDKKDEAKKKDDEAVQAERAGDSERAARLRTEATTLREQAKRLNETYSNGSPVRLLATALTGAAGSNVTGSLGSLAQGAAVNVLQSLATTQVKQLVDGIKGDDATKEGVRAALQAVVGCAGAAAGGSGNCGSAAIGAAASVVLVNLLTARDRPVDSNGDGIVDAKNLEEQQAITDLVTTIIAGVAVGAGIDVPSATLAAQIEAENNGVCNSAAIDCTTTVAEIRARAGKQLSELRVSTDPADQARYQEYIAEFGSEERANAFLFGRDELATLGEAVRTGTATQAQQAQYLRLLNAAGGDVYTAQNIAGLERYYSNPANVFTLESNPNYDNARFIDIGRFLLNFSRGTVTGVANDVGEAVEGIEEILRDPAAAFEKTKEAVRFIIENPGQFADIVIGQGLNYVDQVRSASILLEAGLISGDVGAQTRAGQQLGELVGAPIAEFLITAGVGTALKGLKIGGRIINIVTNRDRTPDVDVPGGVPDAGAPNTPNTPNPTRGDGADTPRGDTPDANAPAGREVNTQPRSDPNAPPPPRIEQVNVDNVRPGTREFDLLNSPPPNTRIELSNGNVYVTNAQGIVDEVSFQPRLVTGTRDARQTAVGRQGLDTDVGGHIQACSLGGTCDRVNLFPQNANFNNSAYKIFENVIRRALDAGENVGPVTVRFVRPDPANPRPSGVNVTYTIGGRTRTIPFENQAGGGI